MLIMVSQNMGQKRNKAKNYIMQQLGYSESDAMQFIGQLKVKIPSVRLQQEKFLLGVARLFIDGELRVNDDFKCTNFNQTLKLIASDAHVNEYDNNLNGMSADELINRFADVRVGELSKRKELMGGKHYHQNREYTIVPINSYEEATKYAKYNEWCVTYSEDMFDDKTCNGAGRFYFCLRNGFENVPKKVGPNAPLDVYGLSMIAVSITMEGEPNSITCRWNHDNGGSDSVMDDEQLSDLLGVNFYSVFKPYTREELHAKGFILFDEVQEMLDNGVSPKEIFTKIYNESEGFRVVLLNNKFNFINSNNQLLSKKWFGYAKNFQNGFAIVKSNKKYNFIDVNNKFISKKWFDCIGDFRYGFATVMLNGKWNFINTKGKILSDTWFDNVYAFYTGLGQVRLNDKWNFINTDGKIVSDIWFERVRLFENGLSLVKLNDKWNFINTKGKLLSGTWFDEFYSFDNGLAIVRLNDKRNFINTDGKIISDIWFNFVGRFNEGFSNVMLNGKWNFINTKGEILSDTWFDGNSSFKNELAYVKLNGKWNVINAEGELSEMVDLTELA